MKKILITGAGGYIGSIATYMLLQKGYEVVALDDFSTGYREPLEILEKKYGESQFRFYKKDLASDLNPFFNIEDGIEAVLHYASPCNVDESMKEPQKYFKTVSIGINLLDAMMKHSIEKIVFSSTCAVYGEAQYVPVDEKHPTNPVNPYGESKRMVEKVLEWYGKILNLHFVALRYFNVCGATDDSLIGDSKKPSRHLMQNAVRGAMGIEPFHLTCPTVDTPDGTTIRDYLNVVDLNEAHLAALEYLFDGGKNETINLGTGNGNSVLEIVNTVQDITGKKFELTKTDARAGEYAKMVASTEKAKNILGWTPKRDLRKSVESLVEWYKQHPNGWEY
jgi:UDP-glucose 4-epimerase